MTKRQQQRRRELAYHQRQGGAWQLDGAERTELDSLIARIERARQAQEKHERRVDVQLTLARAV